MHSKRPSEAVALRHTVGDIRMLLCWYQAGIGMKESQEILGQVSIEITNNIYTHVSQKQKIATADKLANFASF